VGGKFVEDRIHHFKRGAKRGGGLTARAHVESMDELGRLTDTFNQMTTQLRELNEQLEQQEKHLTH